MNRFLLLIAYCLIMTGSTGNVEGSSERTYLWRDLYAGMQKSDVKAAYPKYQGELFPDCPVRVLSSYRNGGLRAVSLLAKNEEPGCLDKLVAQLTAEHGQPVRETETNQMTMPLPNRLAGSIARNDTIWNAGNYRIMLSNFPGARESFIVGFTIDCIEEIC